MYITKINIDMGVRFCQNSKATSVEKNKKSVSFIFVGWKGILSMKWDWKCA